MSFQDEQERKNALISKIYDVILDPDKTQEFLTEWDDYVSTVLSEQESHRNTERLDDFVLRDEELETHFARVYAVLEKVKQHELKVQLSSKGQNSEAFLLFNLSGKIIEQSATSIPEIGNIKSASDLCDLLAPDSINKWNQLFCDKQRAPTAYSPEILFIEDHGNLLAFHHRNEETGEFNIAVKWLKVHWKPELQELLADQFKLSSREIELVESLTKHGSLDQIAQAGGRSKNTLRTQMKSVFKKMKLHSQSEVVQTLALLARFCETFGIQKPADSKTVNLGRIENIVLSSGVNVPIHFLGPEDGRPIIFIHGMLDGVAITPTALRCLHQHNLRLIAPIRPNFGSAASVDAIKDTPQIFAQQLDELTDTLEIKDFLLLGHMSGSVFSFCAAKQLGSKALGIVNISGGVPILSNKQFSGQSMRQRAFAYTARYAPKIFPTLMKAGLSQLDIRGPQSLMNDMHPKNTLDGLAIKDPEISAVIADGYRFATAQGVDGFHGDALHVVHNWSSFVRGTTHPVLLLHGAHDTVMIAKYVQEFAQANDYEIKLYANEGQLVFYKNPDLVLGDIAEFYERLISGNG